MKHEKKQPKKKASPARSSSLEANMETHPRHGQRGASRWRGGRAEAKEDKRNAPPRGPGEEPGSELNKPVG